MSAGYSQNHLMYEPMHKMASNSVFMSCIKAAHLKSGTSVKPAVPPKKELVIEISLKYVAPQIQRTGRG
jgi:hypothetical protein